MQATLTLWQRLARSRVSPARVASSRGGFSVRFVTSILLVFSLATPAMVHAQAATGEVTGRVQNATNGTYMNNARVTVEGTTLQTFTNEYGDYRLSGVPAGEAKIRAFFTGLDPQTVTVNVVAGSTVQRDFRLTRGGVEAAAEGDVVVLDPFVVASQRDTNAASIAANEQRFSNSLKSVVSADAFGDVTEGNIGEFMKFIPGVSVDYVAADVRTMSVRGFADNFTSVSVDGARLASSASGANSRAFEFEQVSINNVTRVEIVKSPTPSMPADSLGGAVNMVSKNAFERDRAEFKYRAYVSMNSEDLQFFKKTPGPMNKPTYKVLPGFDFDYTLPVNKNLGIVITGLSSNQFNEQHRSQTVWNHAQAGAIPANPYLQQYLFQDGPKNTFRQSVSAKVDWKITPNQVLSFSAQANGYLSQFGNRNFTYNVGTSNTSTPSGGTPLTYSSTMTSGATGRGTVQGQTSFRDKHGATVGGVLKWDYFGSDWDFNVAANYSKSRTWYRDTMESGGGHFSEVRTNMNNVSRVVYEGIEYPRPQTFKIYNSAGALLDPTKLANYTVTFGRGNPIDAYDQFSGIDFNVTRRLDFFPVPALIKFGASFREQNRDARRYDESWNLASGTTGANWVDRSYFNQDPYWGLPNQEWPDAYALLRELKSNPSAFAQTAAQQLAAERFRRQNSSYLTEKVKAYYIQGETKLMDNRLNIVGGVRFEKTEDYGRGPLTKGPTTTMALLLQNFIERGYIANRDYDGAYPSLHFTYNVTPNIDLRLSYSKTIGRPDLSNILPLSRVNDTNTTVNDGIGDIPAFTAFVSNTGLQPWDGDSYDLSLAYYFPKGGLLSFGVFRKDIANFFGVVNRLVTAQDAIDFGLDPSYVGVLTLRSLENAGDAKITGVEVDFQKKLDIIPGVGKYLNVFANGTKLDLNGPNSADFAKFIEETVSWGITFSKKPVVMSLKWNYRGRQRLNAQTGSQYGTAVEFREYYAPRTFLDVNLEWKFNKRFTVFANARNVLNEPQTLERYSALTPAYARVYRVEEFGVQTALGIKGTF